MHIGPHALHISTPLCAPTAEALNFTLPLTTLYPWSPVKASHLCCLASALCPQGGFPWWDPSVLARSAAPAWSPPRIQGQSVPDTRPPHRPCVLEPCHLDPHHFSLSFFKKINKFIYLFLTALIGSSLLRAGLL